MKKLNAYELKKLSKLAAMQHLMGWSTSELSAFLWANNAPPAGKGSKGSYIDQVLAVTHPAPPSAPPAAAEPAYLQERF